MKRVFYILGLSTFLGGISHAQPPTTGHISQAITDEGHGAFAPLIDDQEAASKTLPLSAKKKLEIPGRN